MAAKIIPERIREAREGAGLTDEQFAEAIGVTRQAVGNYEVGVSSPRGETLTKIIAVTGQPPTFFTAERKGTERFGTPNWRSLKRMQRPDRLRIGRRLEWAFYISELVSRYVELPPVVFPEIYFDFENGRDEEIEAIADNLRVHWSLGFGPILDLPPILEYHGVTLIEEVTNCEDMDAVSRWQAGRPYILYAKQTESVPRKHYNLAHELGHLLLHNGLEVSAKNIERMEKQANRFAGAFLMPRKTFAPEVANTSIDYFLSLKGRWRVAVAAMAYRCKDLGILNPYQIQYIWKQMNARNIRKREPLDTAFKISSPTVLSSAIEMIVQAKRLTRAQIVEELALNVRHVEALAGLPDGGLGNKVLPFSVLKKIG